MGNVSERNLLAVAYAGLPDGITVSRGPFAPELVWIVRDEQTRNAVLVEVDPAEHERPWTPPQPPSLWRAFLNPLGAVLDSFDRARRYERMKGSMVVDWDAVDAEAKAKGGAAIAALLEARPSASP